MQEIGATGLLEGTGGGGGGGTVDSVVAGAGISVDNTDPANPIVTNTATGGSPAGADTEIQYNDAGAFGASSDFVFNDTTKVFQVKHGGDNLLLVSAAAGDYGLGDLDGIGNNTRFFIDDTIKVASIAAGGDRIRLNIDGTAFTGKIGDIDGIGNSTILVVDDATANKKVTSSGTVITVGALNSSNAPTSDPITISGTFTGSATTTYTITVAGSAVDFNWTDGTNSGTNVPMNFGSPTLLSNGISVTFDGFTYTPTEYWTQTYTASVVQRLSLDYKNDIYQMGNLAGSGVRGRLYIDGTNGIASLRSFDSGLGITSFIQTTQTGLSFSSADVNNSSSLTGSANQTRLATTNTSTFDTGNLFTTNNSARLYFQNGGSSSYWGVKATDGVVKVGDFDLLGNSTLLTLDDTNSKITVNNRFETDKGADIAAANNLTLGGDGNLFVITGNTQINAITTANRQAGSMITLIFTGTPTVKHNTAGGAGTAVLFLAGSVDLTAAANTVLCLIYDGTQWQETSRKVA